MSKTTTYDPQMLSQMRANLAKVFESYREATGFSATFCTEVACGDPKFYRSYQEKDFRVGTYDKVLGRLSAVWPDGAQWPDGIGRPEPIDPGESIRAEIAARNSKEAADG